jgi:phosphinothricin acetyltransferase
VAWARRSWRRSGRRPGSWASTRLLGKLFEDNAASAGLVRRCGFRVVGTHLRHGQLEGEWRDVILVERVLAGWPTIE